jgi:hypothetical protein
MIGITNLRWLSAILFVVAVTCSYQLVSADCPQGCKAITCSQTVRAGVPPDFIICFQTIDKVCHYCCTGSGAPGDGMCTSPMDSSQDCDVSSLETLLRNPDDCSLKCPIVIRKVNPIVDYEAEASIPDDWDQTDFISSCPPDPGT